MNAHTHTLRWAAEQCKSPFLWLLIYRICENSTVLDELSVPQLKQPHARTVRDRKMLISAGLPRLSPNTQSHLQAGSNVAHTGLRYHKGSSTSCCARTCMIPQEIWAARQPKSLWKNTKGLSQQLGSRHTQIPQPIFSSQHLFHGFTLHDSCAVDQTSSDVHVHYRTIRICEWNQSKLVLSLLLKVFYSPNMKENHFSLFPSTKSEPSCKWRLTI